MLFNAMKPLYSKFFKTENNLTLTSPRYNKDHSICLHYCVFESTADIKVRGTDPLLF